MNNFEPGTKFGYWTVIKQQGKSNTGSIKWLCKCACGKESEVSGTALKKGKSMSCGCYTKSDEFRNKRVTHGKSHTSIYNTWRNLMARCYNPKDINYSNYGGRGIGVCYRWIISFDNFLEDMGEKPTPKHSIDRIDGNGHYEPENCRWATSKEQLRNVKTNLWLESNGIKMVVTDWELRWGIHKNAIQAHMKRGKTFDDVFNFYESGKGRKYNMKITA